MKSIATQLLLFVQNRPTRRNLSILVRFSALLVGMVATYSVLFHYIMAYEGWNHSWITGVYWTLTVMSTLGFGDITFESDLGRLFSIVVLVSGTIFLLVLLPFTFIQFFYAPWMEAKSSARAPRQLPAATQGHVILTNYDPVTEALVKRLDRFGYEFVMLVPELEEALKLHDLGLRVMVGDPASPETYEHARAESAAMVVTTGAAALNANVALIARSAAPDVPVVATADDEHAALVLRLAGAKHILTLSEMMGESLARRTIGGDAVSHVIGRLDELLIAEANASRTPLVDRTIAENGLSDMGVSVLGIWDRGRFDVAQADTIVGQNAVIMLAGSREQLDAYDEAFAIYNVSGLPVVVIGAGRVGRATARALKERGIDSRVIELDENAAREIAETVGVDNVIIGDADNIKVLRSAGIEQAPAVILSSHDDTLDVYLTILLRHIRPDIQIISRATLERSVRTLHEAGADFVMSSASLGSNVILNLLHRANIVPIAEGLNVIRIKTPPGLAGKRLVDTSMRQDTGATIIAVVENGQMRVNPDPTEPIPAEAEILLIGTSDTEQKFLDLYGTD